MFTNKIQLRLKDVKIHDGVRGDVFERLITGDDHRHGHGIPDYIGRDGLRYEVKQASGTLDDVLGADMVIYCPWLPYTVTGYNVILRVKDFVNLHRAYVLPASDFMEAMDRAGALRVKSSSADYRAAKAFNAQPKKSTVGIQTVINWTRNEPYGEPWGKLLERILHELDNTPTAIDFREWWAKEKEEA